MDDIKCKLAIAEMSPEEFENLVHAIVFADELDGELVKKLRPPDGGADTIIMNADGSIRLVVQAKRYNHRVNWDKCLESYRRAVSRWQPEALRFVFSQDFTERQFSNFYKHLSNLKDGTKVLIWTLSDLVQLLNMHPLIGPRFFGPDWHSITTTIERATRLGGATLSSGKDLIARAQELGRFGDELDPNYIYGVSAVPSGCAKPDWEDYPAFTVEVETERAMINIAMWPRHQKEIAKAAYHFKNDEMSRFIKNEARRALAKGEGFKVLPEFLQSTIQPTPTIFNEYQGEIDWWITFKPSKPFPVILTFDSPFGSLELALIMYAIPPNEQHLMAFATLKDGLWVELGIPNEFLENNQLCIYLETDFCSDASQNLSSAQALRKFVTRTSGRVIGPVEFGNIIDSRRISDEFLNELESKIEDFKIVIELEKIFKLSLPFPKAGPTKQDYVALREAKSILKRQGGTLKENTEYVLVSLSDVIGFVQAAGKPSFKTFPVKLSIFDIVLDFGLGVYLSQGMSMIDICPIGDDITSQAKVTMRPINTGTIEWRFQVPIGLSE
jgi:hypothetical protein